MENKKLKVCLIVANVFPIPATKGGAVETMVDNFIEENERQNKLDLVCISIFEEKSHELSKKYKNTKFIHIKDCECNGTADLSFKGEDEQYTKYINRIYEEIKDTDFDYIIFEGGAVEQTSPLLEKLPKEKCILHIHGSIKGDEIMKKYFEYFITVSDFVTEFFTSNNIIPKEKVKTLNNGVKIQNFDKTISEEEKKEIRQKYGIKEDENVILFCGRTIWQKGVKELINAIKLTQNIDKIKLLIMGNSNYAKEVKTEYDMQIIEEAKGYEDKIIFTGFIPNNELYKIYNIANLAVFPTIDEEAFGLVIVEAMASGTPVIATVSGAFPYISKNTKTVLVEKDKDLVKNLAKSIDEVLENPNLREEMSKAGKIRAKDFSNENYYNNYIKLLEEIHK